MKVLSETVKGKEELTENVMVWILADKEEERMSINPAGDQEKSSVAYCTNKNHNFANIGHKNMNDASF